MTPFLRIFSLVSFRFGEALDKMQSDMKKKRITGTGIKCPLQ